MAGKSRMHNQLSLIDVRHFAPQTKWLVSLMGITQTYRFLMAFGGQRIDLPIHIVKYDHPVALVLGLNDANTLCYEWIKKAMGNDIKFDVPAFDSMLLVLRKAKICGMAEDGHTNNQIAGELNMTYGYISNFVSNHCNNRHQECGSKTTKIEPQVDLFANMS